MQRYADGERHKRGNKRHLLQILFTRFSHRTHDGVLHGAVDSTQAIELLA